MSWRLKPPQHVPYLDNPVTEKNLVAAANDLSELSISFYDPWDCIAATIIQFEKMFLFHTINPVQTVQYTKKTSTQLSSLAWAVISNALRSLHWLPVQERIIGPLYKLHCIVQCREIALLPRSRSWTITEFILHLHLHCRSIKFHLFLFDFLWADCRCNCFVYPRSCSEVFTWLKLSALLPRRRRHP